ncbi:MAG TPA: hypothetical protein VMN39_00395, partial [Longimicrobiaceae bacterium]|nr:hypothetical protein [Longimicrobiaceae bacterium]
MDTDSEVPLSYRFRLARHEAAHAVASVELGRGVETITVAFEDGVGRGAVTATAEERAAAAHAQSPVGDSSR